MRSSFPAGKLLGVDLRVHVSFPVLLVLAVLYASASTGNSMRGLGLWLALCLAVVVRETARAIGALLAGLRLRALFLLPVGGIMAFAPRGNTPAKTRLVTVAGPIANTLCGALMLGICYALVPSVHLFAQPWVGVHHLLRSFIWMQFILAVAGLLPSAASNRAPAMARGTQPVEHTAAAQTGAPRVRARAGVRSFGVTMNLSALIALGVVLTGMVLMNLWLVILGAFMLLFAQITAAQASFSQPETESVRVRQVMLTEYTLLSTSDTLSSALERSTHSLQDVFPVVRGDLLVGSVARATLMETLQMQGDGYLQGIMTRSLYPAAPEETLVEALRRSAALGASEFIPVVEDGAMMGVLTPQSLSRAVPLVRTERVRRETRDADE